MYRRNFLFHQYPGSCYTSGKPFTIEVPRPGKYKITATLKTEHPLERVSLRTGSGNLAFTGNIPDGIFRHVTVVNVGNTVPDGWNRICRDRTITVTVDAETDCLSSLSVSEISCPVIYIAGTTSGITVDPANKITAGSTHEIAAADNEIVAGSAPETGQPETRSSLQVRENPPVRWEQMLTAYTDQKIAVSDHSHAGLTMESFRKEGHYAAIREYSRPGDFFFFQFAPAGQTAEDWAPGGSCRRQLARYIIECRERLVFPVLLTLAACYGREGANDYAGRSWEQYLDAYREVSELTETPMIELHRLCGASRDAYAAAGSVAQEIVRICGEFPEKRYRFLAERMRTG